MYGRKAIAPWLDVGLKQRADGKLAVTSNPSKRDCGDCTLCCKVMPVGELEKPAGKWCRHVLKGKGCGVYKDRPNSCRLWSCLWAATPEWPRKLRPKESHVIFDMMTETVSLQNNETGAAREMSAIQLWVDPAFPWAHRSPEVRDMMEMIAERFGLPTLVRFGSFHGLFVWPPSLSPDGRWHEKEAPASPMPEP